MQLFNSRFAGSKNEDWAAATHTFAAFSAKLEYVPTTFFSLTGAFTLAEQSNGINPVKENVTLQIGTSSFDIPPGAFSQEPDGTFVFTGTIGKVNIVAQIVPVEKKRFTYSFTGTGLVLSPFNGKVKVGLTIGTDTGTIRVKVLP